MRIQSKASLIKCFLLLGAMAATGRAGVAGTDASSIDWSAPAAGLLIGGFMILMSVVNGRKAKASVEWPTAPGVVVFSGMTTDETDRNSFYPSVSYTYEVNGQKLRSSRVGFSGVRSKRILKQYPLGSAVQVYFDPSKPATAVLEKSGSTKIGFVVGAAVILVSFVLGIVLR